MTRHLTRFRVVTGALLVAWSAAAASCDKHSPIAPGTDPNADASAVITALRIEGDLDLDEPGETSQLRALAVMSAGPVQDVTSSATWQMSGAATISSTGLMRSHSYGIATLLVSYKTVKTRIDVRVMPPGARIVSGFVREPGSLPVYEALVQVMDGPQTGKWTYTDTAGRFTLTPLGGDVVTIRVARRDYVTATHQLRLSEDLQDLELSLVPSQAPKDLSGSYDVEIEAASICQLPEEVWKRRYQAAVTQEGARVNITFSGASFRPCYRDGPPANQFTGRLMWGTTMQIALGRDDYSCQQDVMEQITPTSYLELIGIGTLKAEDNAITGQWLGNWLLREETREGSAPRAEAECTGMHFMRLFKR
jgi:hypothetical protein